jgi:hypothetical protein
MTNIGAGRLAGDLPKAVEKFFRRLPFSFII